MSEQEREGLPEGYEDLIEAGRFLQEAIQNPKTRKKVLELAKALGYDVNEEEFENPEVKEAVEPLKKELESLKKKLAQEEQQKILQGYYSILERYGLPPSEENVKRIFMYAQGNGISILGLTGFERVVKEYVSNLVADQSFGRPAPPKLTREEAFKRYQEKGLDALKEDLKGLRLL